MDKYRVRVSAIFTTETSVEAEGEMEALIKVREILRNKADRLEWEYESISPEDYWRVLKI